MHASIIALAVIVMFQLLYLYENDSIQLSVYLCIQTKFMVTGPLKQDSLGEKVIKKKVEEDLEMVKMSDFEGLQFSSPLVYKTIQYLS